jgi:hypothetical protein
VPAAQSHSTFVQSVISRLPQRFRKLTSVLQTLPPSDFGQADCACPSNARHEIPGKTGNKEMPYETS